MTLVLMAGLPGVGKTTLAYALGRALQWQVVDKDLYKQVLLKQGFEDDYASQVAYELAFATLRAVLSRQETSVIFDTALLQHFVLDTINEMMSGTRNIKLKVILCFADRDVRTRRLRNRPYQPTNIRVDPASVIDYFAHFKHLPEDRLVLYTTTSFAECLAQARDYILT